MQRDATSSSLFPDWNDILDSLEAELDHREQLLYDIAHHTDLANEMAPGEPDTAVFSSTKAVELPEELPPLVGVQRERATALAVQLEDQQTRLGWALSDVRSELQRISRLNPPSRTRSVAATKLGSFEARA